MAELLRAPSSKVWPPGHVQDLVNIKSNYHKRAEECGIPIAPTLYHTCEGASEGDALVFGRSDGRTDLSVELSSNSQYAPAATIARAHFCTSP